MALQAFSSSPEPADAALSEHLQRCAGCRHYLDTVRAVCPEKAVREAWTTDGATSPGFHARLLRRIEDHQLRRGRMRRMPWAFDGGRVPLRAMAGGLVLLLALAWWLATRPTPQSVREAAPSVALPPPLEAPFRPAPPSVVHYRGAMNRSLEELDALLNQEGAEVGLSQPPTASLGMRDVELFSRIQVGPSGKANL